MIIVSEDMNEISSLISPLLPKAIVPFKFSNSENNKLYVQKDESGNNLAFISMYDGHCTFINNGNADFTEINSFLNFKNCLSVTTTDVKSIYKLNCSFVKYSLLKCKKLIEPNNSEYCVKMLTNAECKSVFADLYKLVYNSDLYFDEWYCDIAKRLNCGFSDAVYITDGNKPISCAFVSASFGDTAIISGIVTDEYYRNKGLASLCLSILNSHLFNKGIKNIYLWCENKLADFYFKYGFEYETDIYVGEYNVIF